MPSGMALNSSDTSRSMLPLSPNSAISKADRVSSVPSVLVARKLILHPVSLGVSAFSSSARLVAGALSWASDGAATSATSANASMGFIHSSYLLSTSLPCRVMRSR